MYVKKRCWEKLVGISLLTGLLVGCASEKPHPIKPQYSPKKYVAADRIPNTLPTVKQPQQSLDAGVVLTSAGFGDNPALKKAYQQYLKTGKADNIKGDGFITLAFNPYAKPIIHCAPLNTCNIMLQKGESINGISLGDSSRWLVDKMYVGQPNNGSWMVIVKPESVGIATDMTIATNQRVYNFGLVSQAGASPTVNFWYPNEMVQDAVKVAKTQQTKLDQTAKNTIASTTSDSPYINVSHLNFNYTLTGDKPDWKPTMVFDDGDKTFIRMPTMTDRSELPVLYIYRNGKQSLVNYRYKRPYFVVDGLFWKGSLISGKGSSKTEVDIHNKNYQ